MIKKLIISLIFLNFQLNCSQPANSNDEILKKLNAAIEVADTNVVNKILDQNVPKIIKEQALLFALKKIKEPSIDARAVKKLNHIISLLSESHEQRSQRAVRSKRIHETLAETLPADLTNIIEEYQRSNLKEKLKDEIEKSRIINWKEKQSHLNEPHSFEEWFANGVNSDLIPSPISQKMLSLAVQHSNVDLVKLLLDLGADPLMLSKPGRTILTEAKIRKSGWDSMNTKRVEPQKVAATLIVELLEQAVRERPK